jgi:hypothetical protein
MAGPVTVPVLWLCGPTAVGKSVVGYELFTQVQLDGITAAYVDLAMIGFCRHVPADDPDNHRIKARNLGAMLPAFRASGARCLVITGGVSRRDTVQRYAEALPDATLTLVRLRAGREQLTQRILLRGRGGGPGIPGDVLTGRPVDDLLRFAQDAVHDTEELARAGIGDVYVDTDDLPVAEVATLVRARTGGWPAVS